MVPTAIVYLKFYQESGSYQCSYHIQTQTFILLVSGSTWFNSLLHYFLLPLGYSGLLGTNYSTLISALVVFYLLFLLKSYFPREPPMSFYLVIDSNIKEPLLPIMFKIAPSPSFILFPLYLTLFFFIPLELLHMCN